VSARELAVCGVWKRYGQSSYAVRDVSFRLQPGEFLTLLGPSGSGKTTTLMMVAGFETPTKGHIRLGGQDIAGQPPQRRNLGVVFQGYGLFPHMTVQENVEFPLRMRGLGAADRRRKAADMLDKVGLAAFAARRPRALSGGQQQRVALARALVFDPAALLLDEPLGALDRRLRESLQVEIKDIQRRLGISVLMVTHDQDEAMTMSDRIAVMHDGRIEQIGSPSELYLHPATIFVAGFLGETNLLPATQCGLSDGYAVMRLADGSFTQARPPSDTAPARVSLRPERVRFLAPGEAADTIVPGIVESCVFLGRHARYAVRALGQRIAVSTTEWPGREPGAVVRLGWSRDDAQCVTSAPGPPDGDADTIQAQHATIGAAHGTA
jgi:putative spermidine/putrescine transport system ATP-binding protein